MPKEHLKEKELLENYDRKLKYYSPANEKDLARIMLTVEAPVSGCMLDVGCGDGRAFQYAHRHGMQYTGIDYSSRRIELARETWGQLKANDHNRPTFLVGDLYEALPSINPGFDLVWCCELLEHLEEPQVIWEEMRRLCTGMVVCTVPVDMPHENHLQVYKNDSAIIKAFPGITDLTHIQCRTPGGHQRDHFLFCCEL